MFYNSLQNKKKAPKLELEIKNSWKYEKDLIIFNPFHIKFPIPNQAIVPENFCQCS